MLDQVFKVSIGQFALVGPAGIIEGGVKTGHRIRVGVLYTHHGIHDGLAYILRNLAKVAPMASRRNDKGMKLTFIKQIDIFSILLDCRLGFLIIAVGNSLQKQKRNDVLFEVFMTNMTMEHVACLIQVIKQLGCGGVLRYNVFRCCCVFCYFNCFEHGKLPWFFRRMCYCFIFRLITKWPCHSFLDFLFERNSISTLEGIQNGELCFIKES